VVKEDIIVNSCVLAESVAAWLCKYGFKCKTVQIVRDNDLSSFERQAKLQRPSQVSTDILSLAMKIFESNYTWGKPLRSIGVGGTDLVSALGNKQLSFLDDDVKEERSIRLESTIDDQRRRLRHFSVQRGLMLMDEQLTDLNPKDDHVIFPVAYKQTIHK
jgi:DNA polymerase IV